MRLCSGCKRITEPVITDELDRSFCIDCVASQPAAREMMLANWVASNIPYRVGDRVSCRTGGTVYDGIGEIAEISTDPRDLATPLVPMFLVNLQDKAYDEVPDTVWYSEPCLAKVDG